MLSFLFCSVIASFYFSYPSTGIWYQLIQACGSNNTVQFPFLFPVIVGSYQCVSNCTEAAQKHVGWNSPWKLDKATSTFMTKTFTEMPFHRDFIQIVILKRVSKHHIL